MLAIISITSTRQIFFVCLRESIGNGIINIMNSFLKSRLFLFFELIILGIVIVGMVRIRIQEKHINQEIASLEKRAADEKEENKQLQERLKSSSGSSYFELEAKRTLNYQKPEETVFVFYTPSLPVNRDTAGNEKADASKQKISNPILWWRYFFGADRGT